MKNSALKFKVKLSSFSSLEDHPEDRFRDHGGCGKVNPITPMMVPGMRSMAQNFVHYQLQSQLRERYYHNC